MTQVLIRRPFKGFFLTIGLLLTGAPAVCQELPNLPPLSPDDLSLKDIRSVPGAPAAILYYAVETDNTKSSETRSVRMKILREEGRERANVEIEYGGKDIQVDSIRARTIDSQGKAQEFSDQIFDREIFKAKKYRVNAKVFTLPNVQVGSIIEYSYRLLFKEKFPDPLKNPTQYIFSSSMTYPAAAWTVQQDFFVRHAHFVLHKLAAPVYEFNLRLAGAQFVETGKGVLQLDFDNVPPYETEEYAPPEDAMRARVNLYYGLGYYGTDGFWYDAAKRLAKDLEPFLKKSKAVEREAARLVSPSDSDENKLRKLYARAQLIRAVSFEAEKTEKERKQENLAENKNVEDVLTRGYAYSNQINLLFIALARAAGFEAYPMLVTSRKNSIFFADWPSESQLNSMIVQVRMGGGTVYLDPATKYCPFELLPWDETATGGVRADTLNPKRGATPELKSVDAVRNKTAHLRLSEDGTLSGKVEVQYSGQEALTLRLDGLERDEAARRKSLEDSIKGYLGQAANVTVVATEGRENSEGPVKVTFEIEIPNYASQAGRRMVLPIGVFHTNERNPFFSGKRANPIYFSYPQEEHEDVSIELPEEMQFESLPQPSKSDQKAAYYDFIVSADGKTLHLKRTFRLAAYLIDRDQYSALRIFYQRVLSGDAQQMTLVTRTEKAAK